MVRMTCLLVLLALPAWFADAADNTFLVNGVTAHRGNSFGFPENTLPAFQSGMDLGADWIELDIFLTADGKLVITHDRDTMRVSGKSRIIPETNYDELKRLDVAADFRNRQQLTLADCPAETMPLLEDVLRLVIQQRKTRVSIQPKVNCVPQAIEIIHQLHAESWVGFNDGNLDLMSEVKRLAPQLPVFWDRPGMTDLQEDLRIARDRGFETIVLHFSGVTPE